ncbi:MAG: multidrug ABC transporter ATP-binding protein [Actinobacteria bacterium HGW-Actinobacteria-7]|nr:MAG: multidrug ABC transporter ATP-binding protein [Actinobacteria bacterium HGW-Actinobacteria-7]
MRKLLSFLKPYLPQLIFVMVLLLVQAITNLYLPDLNAKIINEGVAKGDTAFILRTGGIMLAVTFLLGITSIISVYWGSKTAMAFGRDVRGAIFRRVESFSQSEINIFGTPSLITRNTNDVQQVQMVVLMMLNVMISAPFMAVGGIIMALRQDVPLSALIVVIIPLMGVLIGTMLVRAMPLFKQMQVRVDRVNQVTREKLSGVRVIRAFVRTNYEEHRFDVANADLTEVSLAVNRIFAAMIPALMAIFNLSTVAIMWFGGLRVDHGGMPIGNLTAFLTYIMQILMSVMMATIMFVMVPRAAASWTRIKAVLDTEPAICDPELPAAESETCGRLEFRDVEFRYPGAEEPVLCGISFTATPGEVTAIVGSTGCGKSTLINLIPRFFDVTSGAVLIDGVDVREMPQHRVWDKIGFIPQKAFLFTGTVAENLRYGKEDATEDELWHALEVAQGKKFVSAMAEKLDAPITQGGSNVSGGQRQRLAIARALVKRPEIYVFDDSFSALDFTTDAKLRAALTADTRDSTVLIVAQRVSTIMNADRIIVLDAGRIVGMGTHAELLEDNETYREIVFSQMSEEEVA